MRVHKPTLEEIEKSKLWGTWSKEVSEFPWYYEDNETCYILEGEAQVTDKEGNSISFEPGDWVEFPQGLECTWKISKAIKKRYKFG